MLRQGRRVVVTFPHRGEALRTQRLLRKVDAEVVDESVESLPRRSCTSIRRQPGTARIRLARPRSRSFFPTRRCSESARRAQTRDSVVRSSRSPTFVQGDYVVHEDHGLGRLLGFETKEVAGVTRDYLYLAFRARTDCMSRTSSFRRSRATSARTRGCRRSRSSAGRPGKTSRAVLAPRCASSPASSSLSTRSASRHPGMRSTSPTTGSSGSKARSRIGRRTTSYRRSRR